MTPVDNLDFALALLGAVGCGLVAGVFFAFSSFVMKALSRLAPAEAIVAMQSINAVVLHSWFMAAFLGTAAVCAVAMIFSLWWWRGPGLVFMFAGSLCYLVGCFLVTILFNVPRNKALAAVAPSGLGSESVWTRYVSGWTAWNHVRTVAAFAAAILFSIALAY